MLAVKEPRVLIVGAGCTGAYVSRALRRRLPSESVVVWESSSYVGGRMRTEYAQLPDGNAVRSDTGAQYITQDGRVAAAHEAIYAALRTAGVLVPFQGDIEGTRAADGGGANYVCPEGLGALVEHVLSEAGVTPICNRCVESLHHRQDTEGTSAQWEVQPSDGPAERFDAVLLTAPVPQQLQLLGQSGLEEWVEPQPRAQMDKLQYSARCAPIPFRHHSYGGRAGLYWGRAGLRSPWI